MPGARSPLDRIDERGVVEVASAATITIPSTGRVTLARITGTTSITSITATPEDRGRLIILKFSSTLGGSGVVDGSNLKLSGNFAADADDTLTLGCWDGINWTEVSRSPN